MTYKQTAKELGVRWRVWKYGIRFGRPQSPAGPYGFWGVRLVCLDGWSFDSHEIIESFANDPVFSISYKDKK